ncbi:MAG: twin-arginine translocase TatA/TatE family subunit [Thermoanaerobaculales bacterium]|jgi:sec-independent protein translocase protein TatA
MFGSVGIPELIMIFVVALLLFGPKKLPEIGRSLGKALGEFKRATNDLQRSLEEEVAATELKQTKRDLEDALKPGAAVAATPAAAPVVPEPSNAPTEPSTVAVEPKPSATEPK